MSDTARPLFYKPDFGNDNPYGSDVVDIAAFTAPLANAKDAAAKATKTPKKSA